MYIPWSRKPSGQSVFYIKSFKSRPKAEKASQIIEHYLNNQGYTFEEAKKAGLEAVENDTTDHDDDNEIDKEEESKHDGDDEGEEQDEFATTLEEKSNSVENTKRKKTNLAKQKSTGTNINRSNRGLARGSIYQKGNSHELHMYIPRSRKPSGKSSFYIKCFKSRPKAEKVSQIIEHYLNNQGYTFEEAKKASLEAVENDATGCDGKNVDNEEETEQGNDADDEEKAEEKDRLSTKGDKDPPARCIILPCRNDKHRLDINIPWITNLSGTNQFYVKVFDTIKEAQLAQEVLEEYLNIWGFTLEEAKDEAIAAASTLRDDNCSSTSKNEDKKGSKGDKMDGLGTGDNQDEQLVLSYQASDRDDVIKAAENLCHQQPRFPLGTRVQKKFDGVYFSGEIISYCNKKGWYRVLYEDNDEEEYNEEELKQIMESSTVGKGFLSGHRHCLNAKGITEKGYGNNECGADTNDNDIDGVDKGKALNHNHMDKQNHSQLAYGRIYGTSDGKNHQLHICVPWLKNTSGSSYFYVKSFSSKKQAIKANQVAEKCLNELGYTYEDAKKIAIQAVELDGKDAEIRALSIDRQEVLTTSKHDENKSSLSSSPNQIARLNRDRPSYGRIYDTGGKYRLWINIPWMKNRSGTSQFHVKLFNDKKQAITAQETAEKCINVLGYTFEAAKKAAIEAAQKDDEDSNDESHDRSMDQQEVVTTSIRRNKKKSNLSKGRNQVFQREKNQLAYSSIYDRDGKYVHIINIPWMKNCSGTSQFYVKTFTTKKQANVAQEMVEKCLNVWGYTYEAAKKAAIEATEVGNNGSHNERHAQLTDEQEGRRNNENEANSSRNQAYEVVKETAIQAAEAVDKEGSNESNIKSIDQEKSFSNSNIETNQSQGQKRGQGQRQVMIFNKKRTRTQEKLDESKRPRSSAFSNSTVREKERELSMDRHRSVSTCSSANALSSGVEKDTKCSNGKGADDIKLCTERETRKRERKESQKMTGVRKKTIDSTKGSDETPSGDAVRLTPSTTRLDNNTDRSNETAVVTTKQIPGLESNAPTSSFSNSNRGDEAVSASSKCERTTPGSNLTRKKRHSLKEASQTTEIKDSKKSNNTPEPALSQPQTKYQQPQLSAATNRQQKIPVEHPRGQNQGPSERQTRKVKSQVWIPAGTKTLGIGVELENEYAIISKIIAGSVLFGKAKEGDKILFVNGHEIRAAKLSNTTSAIQHQLSQEGPTVFTLEGVRSSPSVAAGKKDGQSIDSFALTREPVYEALQRGQCPLPLQSYSMNPAISKETSNSSNLLTGNGDIVDPRAGPVGSKRFQKEAHSELHSLPSKQDTTGSVSNNGSNRIGHKQDNYIPVEVKSEMISDVYESKKNLELVPPSPHLS